MREDGVRVLVATVLRGAGAATCAPKFFSVTVDGAGTLVVALPKKESKPVEGAGTLVVVLPKKESKPELEKGVEAGVGAGCWKNEGAGC